MPYDSGDAITAEAVRAQAESIAQENLVFRRAFRPLDATSINSNSMKVPVPDDAMGEIKAVPEGTEYERDKETFTKVEIDHKKYGKEVEITDEAVQDGMLDGVREQAEAQARMMAEGMDNKAFTELNGNLSSETIGDSNGTLTYNNVVDSMTTMADDPYNFAPSILFVGPSAMGDLLKSQEFTQASDLGDRTITRGRIGSVAGLDVWTSNTGDLAAGEAIMVDPNFYGYESTRRNIETEEYDDRSKDARIIKIRARKGWKAMKSDAALKITG